MAHVDLCSGIGGFALGFEWAGLSKPVLFCDIEPWSRKILKKHWPDVPICEDVKELADDPDRYVSRNLDWSNTILSAGYPCQPFSVAGRQRGTEDPRHIWPWLLKLVALKRPKFCVFENVNGHIALGLDKVLNDLEGEDYAVTTLIIPASSVGAPHKRERLWIVAHANSNSQSDVTKHEQERLVGNSQHDGSSTSTIKGSNQENARRSTQGAIKAEQSERASGRGHYEDVADTDSTRQQQSYKKMEDSSSKQSDSSDIQSRQNVADTASKGLEGSIRQISKRSRNGSSNESNDVADTSSEGLEGRQQLQQHTKETGRRQEGAHGSVAQCCDDGAGQTADSTAQPRMGDLANGLSKGLDRFGKHDGFEIEPSDIPRVASGIKDRANRLKGLGNAIVPQIAMQIGLAIKESQWK